MYLSSLQLITGFFMPVIKQLGIIMEIENNVEYQIRGTESYDAVISSEFPVERDGMDEVLMHTEDSIDLSRFPVPLLVNHNMDNQIGVVENPRIENGKLIASIRFTNDFLGKQYEEDVIDKVRNNLSIGYRILKWLMELEKLQTS
jgi:hypothetical protein